MVNAELKTEINQLKSDKEELKAQLWQKDHKILQLENEISSSRLESTGSCSKKAKQEPIDGTVDVHFYVQRESNLGSVTSGVIPFEFAPVNEGNAFDLSSGIFTAPVNGYYHFQFSALRYDSADEYDETYLKLAIEVNGGIIDFSQKDLISLLVEYYHDLQNLFGTYKSVSMSLPLLLNPGDKVNLINFGGGGKLEDDASKHYTHFCGWLVEEA